MALTLADVSASLADKVAQEVIDEFRRNSYLLDNLIFDDAVSPGTGGSTLTYGYTQLSTPSTAAFREINSEYESNEAKKVKKSCELKIFGGSASIDRVLQKASGEKEIEFQLQEKIKATSNLFNYAAINGGTTSDVKEFDGLSKLLKGKSTEYNTGDSAEIIDLSNTTALDANHKYFIDMMNEFLSGLDGKPGIIASNSIMIARLKSIAYRAGYLTKSEDSFGKAVQGYDDIIFVDLGKYHNGTKSDNVVPIYDSGDNTGLTDLYTMTLGLDGFHGVSLSGGNIIDTYLPDLASPGAVKKAEVEMIAAVALKNTTKAGVFRNIKVA